MLTAADIADHVIDLSASDWLDTDTGCVDLGRAVGDAKLPDWLEAHASADGLGHRPGSRAYRYGPLYAEPATIALLHPGVAKLDPEGGWPCRVDIDSERIAWELTPAAAQPLPGVTLLEAEPTDW